MTTTVTVKVRLTKRVRDNLARLAIGLRTDRKRKTEFRMMDYASVRGVYDARPTDVKNECGTTCCAVGHAPLYCKTRPKRDDNWNEYAARVLGVKEVTPGGSIGHHLFDFLFQSDWPDDIKQFSARVWHVLKTGEVLDAAHRNDQPKYPVPRIKDLEPYLSSPIIK